MGAHTREGAETEALAEWRAEAACATRPVGASVWGTARGAHVRQQQVRETEDARVMSKRHHRLTVVGEYTCEMIIAPVDD